MTADDLKKFGEYIKIRKDKYDGKSKLKVHRAIRSKIEEEIEEQDNPSEFLDDIQLYFTKEPPASEGETGKDETTDNTCDKKDQDKVEVHVVKVNSAENDTVCTKGVVNRNVKYESVSTGKSPELLSPTSSLKKDFCIIGQGGNKDKLAFLGLCTQIDEGLSKGYTEREVISGILNAISLVSGLSGYLNPISTGGGGVFSTPQFVFCLYIFYC